MGIIDMPPHKAFRRVDRAIAKRNKALKDQHDLELAKTVIRSVEDMTPSLHKRRRQRVALVYWMGPIFVALVLILITITH